MKEASVEIEKFVRLEDVETDCACASRTCGPHRCWPSRLAWGVVGGLLIYALVMHSFQFTERENLRGKLTEAMTERIARHDLELRETLTQMVRQQNDELLQPTLKRLDDRAQAVEEVLARARRVEWAVLTPDVERDVQTHQVLADLRRQVSDLAQRVH